MSHRLGLWGPRAILTISWPLLRRAGSAEPPSREWERLLALGVVPTTPQVPILPALEAGLFLVE